MNCLAKESKMYKKREVQAQREIRKIIYKNRQQENGNKVFS